MVGSSGRYRRRSSLDQILTAMFLHGSWSHIIGNMVFFWAFGPEIEDAMNPLRFSAFYLSGGLLAKLAQVLASPNSTVPNLGASGGRSCYLDIPLHSLQFWLELVRRRSSPSRPQPKANPKR